MTLKKYYTGLVWQRACNVRVHFPSPVGKGWRVSFQKPRLTLRTGDSCNKKEVIIYATSRDSAQRALHLIDNCSQLIDGDPHIFPVDLVAFNVREIGRLPAEDRKRIEGQMKSNTIVNEACELAAKISHRRNKVYALAKYCLSMQSYSNFSMDLQYDEPHFRVSKNPGDHVLFAHCIATAYSAIEELGLEVRASQKKPSHVAGRWNPPVLEDIEKRLDSAHIDRSDTFPWLLRVPRRTIETKKSLPITRRAPWAYGKVRDHEVCITDAIAYASWLRSRVSSHTIKNTTRRLTAYDVANVQFLARRLLLESNGFW